MIDKEFLDKILDQAIEEASTIYIEGEELNIEDINEVEEREFSDIHKQKMKNLFKEVRRNENRKKIVKLTKKVAIIILCTLLITCGLITSVEAWRKEVIKFIMKNNDDNYMSIDFGNSGEKEEVPNEKSGDANQYIIDDIKFLYVPEGFKAEKEKTLDYLTYYRFSKR